MYKMHQIEKLSFWFDMGTKRCCYSLTYNEKAEILHVFNHAYPNTHSLYTCLISNSDEFVGKVKNQMKFATRGDLSPKTRIFFYDRSQIVFEWDFEEKSINPLAEKEWYLLYTPYLKPFPPNLKKEKGRVISE